MTIKGNITLIIMALTVVVVAAGCGRPGTFTSSGQLIGVITSTVDSNGDTGYFTSLAMDSNNHPWIAYYDNTAGVLKLAHFNGANFVTEVVDDNGNTGLYPSLALNANNMPRITYYDATDRILKYAYKTLQGWVIQSIDPFSPNGKYSSLKLDAAGNPHFSYVTAAPLNDELKYGLINSQGLSLDIVDNGGSQQTGYGTGNIDFTTSLQLTPNGAPVISYYDASNGILKMADYDPATQQWKNQIVADGSKLQAPSDHPFSKDVGMYNSLVLDKNNNPHISYYDADYGTLRYAYFNGVIWNYEYIDRESFVGAYNSIALAQNGVPVVAYQDITNGALKIAFRQKKGWKIFYVDRSDYYRTGYWISLSVAPDGSIGISYRNATSHALMFSYIKNY